MAVENKMADYIRISYTSSKHKFILPSDVLDFVLKLETQSKIWRVSEVLNDLLNHLY